MSHNLIVYSKRLPTESTALINHLSQQFHINAMHNWQQFCWHTFNSSSDLIILDWDKYDTALLNHRISQLRRFGIEEPIIALVEDLSIATKLDLLSNGCDDCFNSRVSLAELTALVQMRIKRRPVNRSEEYLLKDMSILPDERRIRRGEAEVHLRPREFAILRSLLEGQGKVLTRDELIRKTNQHLGDDVYPNTIDVHISRLRKTIDHDQDIIETVHGLGYRINKKWLT